MRWSRPFHEVLSKQLVLGEIIHLCFSLMRKCLWNATELAKYNLHGNKSWCVFIQQRFCCLPLSMTVQIPQSLSHWCFSMIFLSPISTLHYHLAAQSLYHALSGLYCFDVSHLPTTCLVSDMTEFLNFKVTRVIIRHKKTSLSTRPAKILPILF